jgi:hypothetical protein
LISSWLLILIMKKRVPGFRVFAVMAVLMLAAHSVPTPTLRTSNQLDALPEFVVVRTPNSGGCISTLESQVTSIEAEQSPEIFRYAIALFSTVSPQYRNLNAT